VLWFERAVACSKTGLCLGGTSGQESEPCLSGGLEIATPCMKASQRDCLTGPSPGPPEPARQISLTPLAPKIICTNLTYYFEYGSQSDCVQQKIIFHARDAFLALCLTHCGGLVLQMRSLQSQIEQRGTRIFELVNQHPESLFSSAAFYQRMMALSMRDEQFKAQLFRFVDVLPSLRRSGEIVEHLEEYFADLRDGFAPLVHTGVRLARIVPWVSGRVLRWNISGMARQFIAGKNPDDVMKMLRKRRAQKIGFTVDLLGEAVVSETETDEYAARCLDLLETLARETRGWTDPLGRNSELFRS